MPKKTKTKSASPAPIKLGDEPDLDLVNAKFEELAQAKAALHKIDADCEDQVSTLKKNAVEAGAKFRKIIEEIDAFLEAFAKKFKRKLFSAKAKTRNVKLTGGTFGFKKGPPRIEVKNEAKTIQILKDDFGGQAVRIVESVDIAKLKDWSDEDLKKIGAKREQDDNFFKKLNDLPANATAVDAKKKTA